MTEVRCLRCGDDIGPNRDRRLCESCEKTIQLRKLADGVPCDRCDGHGWIYSTYCDIQRAMNGRDRRCPECHGSGQRPWNPDLEDVHPDLRAEVAARAE